jgi:hypothetical protein
MVRYALRVTHHVYINKYSSSFVFRNYNIYLDLYVYFITLIITQHN